MLNRLDTRQSRFCLRPAVQKDQAELDRLHELSLTQLLGPFLTRTQQAAVREYTPIDYRLIEDGTYFVVTVDHRIAACGGWSRRNALYRRKDEDGSATDRFLDPQTDAATVRAMYTHPDFARRGLGSVLLAASEAAARLAGFSRVELLATPAGEKLYLARGWQIQERLTVGEDADAQIPVCRMSRCLA